MVVIITKIYLNSRRAMRPTRTELKRDRPDKSCCALYAKLPEYYRMCPEKKSELLSLMENWVA